MFLPPSKTTLEQRLMEIANQRANEARAAWEQAVGPEEKQQTFSFYFKRLQILHKIVGGLYGQIGS